jgi:MraZ protein
MYFLGTYPQTVDDKGRVVIPARLRDQLSELQDTVLVATKWRRRNQPCLDVHPFSGWQKEMSRLQAKRRSNPRIGAFETWYTGNAAPIEPDGQGRVVLPQGLRDYARLERDVVLVGAHDRFRIWNRDLYDRVNGEDEVDIFADGKLLEEIER